MTSPASPQPDVVDRLPHAAPGWWCWRCGWWKSEQPGQYQPAECPDCSAWSRERHLPTDTLRRVHVTLELSEGPQ